MAPMDTRARRDGFDMVDRAMAAASITQRQLAKDLGFHPGVVCRLLKRTRKPSLELAIALEDRLGVPIRVWPQTHVRGA